MGNARAYRRACIKEKIMSQDKQAKKVKQYRAMKIAFYCLGFPLFFIAVFLAAVKFIGTDPFTGTSDVTTQLGFFHSIEIMFTSPALFGVYLAFGVWMLITIVHAILGKAVKSRRARTLAVVALCLVVMLGGVFAMDTFLGAKVDEIASNAPSGVTVADYKTQLSYYRTISSKINPSKNMTVALSEQVDLLENVYNVGMEGIEKCGVSGNIGNKPVTYADIIDDEGNTGVDISFERNHKTGFYELACEYANGKNRMTPDGNRDNDNLVVRLAPNSKGELVINDTVYSHYFYVYRASVTGPDVYVWYAKDLMPTSWEWKLNTKNPAKTDSVYKPIDGIYGKGIYNSNGMLSDGWVFSLENAVEILEDYYAAKNAIENGDEYGTAEEYARYYAEMYEKAAKARDDYYNGVIADADGNFVDPWLSALYRQEIRMTERFSITRGELEELLAKVGALLGDNQLFDFIFGAEGDSNINNALGSALTGIVNLLLPTALGPLFKQLNEGISLTRLLKSFSGLISALDDNTINTVKDLIIDFADRKDDGIKDLYITAAYKKNDAFGRRQDHLYVAIFRDDGNGEMGKDPTRDILIELDFDDRLIDGAEGDYAFDLDAVSKFLSVGINNLLKKYNIEGLVGTIGGLVFKDMDFNGMSYKGLNVAGISIPIINNDTGKIDLDINGILMNLLSGYYSYQSSVIKPVWEFYESEENFNRQGELIQDYRWAAAEHFRTYERAKYMGKIHGTMIGSVLIGDSLGSGAYPSSLGLQDLQSVQQLKTDLSYQALFFPLYSLRDMLALFSGIVILFYFISFVAAQKEEDYATGKLLAHSRKDKNTDGEDGGGTLAETKNIFGDVPSDEHAAVDTPVDGQSEAVDLQQTEQTEPTDLFEQFAAETENNEQNEAFESSETELVNAEQSDTAELAETEFASEETEFANSEQFEISEQTDAEPVNDNAADFAEENELSYIEQGEAVEPSEEIIVNAETELPIETEFADTESSEISEQAETESVSIDNADPAGELKNVQSAKETKHGKGRKKKKKSQKTEEITAAEESGANEEILPAFEETAPSVDVQPVLEDDVLSEEILLDKDVLEEGAQDGGNVQGETETSEDPALPVEENSDKEVR